MRMAEQYVNTGKAQFQYPSELGFQSIYKGGIVLQSTTDPSENWYRHTNKTRHHQSDDQRLNTTHRLQTKNRTPAQFTLTKTSSEQIEWKDRKKVAYFSGTYIDERDAPIPGVPCLTGLFVIANSPRQCPIISGFISTGRNSLPL